MGTLGDARQVRDQGQLQLSLVWVERTTDSTAAGAHLRGTLARLVDPRFSLRVFTDDSAGVRWLPAIAQKVWRIVSVLAPAAAARPRGVLLARWSPFISLISRRWRRRNLPIILFVQGNLDDLYDSNPWTRRVSWITTSALNSIRDATQIVTPSEGLADWVSTLRQDGRASVTVIPNGVDLALFDEARRRADHAEVAPHALFFGNMARWQGIDTVLAALADPAWPSDLQAWFIGDGQMADAVRESPDPRVRYLGRLPKADVASAVARAEITLATRHADGASATGVSPFKIIESAAAGTVSVVTRVPGQTELAQDIGGSELIPPDEPRALAETVARLHADRSLRQQLAADAVAGVRRYDWAENGSELTAIVLAVAGLGTGDEPGRALSAPSSRA